MKTFLAKLGYFLYIVTYYYNIFALCMGIALAVAMAVVLFKQDNMLMRTVMALVNIYVLYSTIRIHNQKGKLRHFLFPSVYLSWSFLKGFYIYTPGFMSAVQTLYGCEGVEPKCFYYYIILGHRNRDFFSIEHLHEFLVFNATYYQMITVAIIFIIIFVRGQYVDYRTGIENNNLKAKKANKILDESI